MRRGMRVGRRGVAAARVWMCAVLCVLAVCTVGVFAGNDVKRHFRVGTGDADEVRRLQQMLNKCGPRLAATGNFDMNTKQALRTFQRGRGVAEIACDKVTEKTWEMLDECECGEFGQERWEADEARLAARVEDLESRMVLLDTHHQNRREEMDELRAERDKMVSEVRGLRTERNTLRDQVRELTRARRSSEERIRKEATQEGTGQGKGGELEHAQEARETVQAVETQETVAQHQQQQAAPHVVERIVDAMDGGVLVLPPVGLWPVWVYAVALFACVGAVAACTQCWPLLWTSVRPEQDLKAVYGAQWAFVSGATSGIGLALVHKLAQQGISMVLLARDMKNLDRVAKELRKTYPALEFRVVWADLTQDPKQWMRSVRQVTKDLLVRLVFLNAGYLRVYPLHMSSEQMEVDEAECNAVSVVRLAQYFYEQMIPREYAVSELRAPSTEAVPDSLFEEEKGMNAADAGIPWDEHVTGRRGAIVFTSSSTVYLPSPFTTVYSGSKAFLRQFALSLAAEASRFHVDVLSVQPGFVETRLFEKAPPMPFVLGVLRLIGQTPQSVARVVFKSVGRCVSRDTGLFAVLIHPLSLVLGPQWMVWLVSWAWRILPECRSIARGDFRKEKET